MKWVNFGQFGHYWKAYWKQCFLLMILGRAILYQILWSLNQNSPANILGVKIAEILMGIVNFVKYHQFSQILTNIAQGHSGSKPENFCMFWRYIYWETSLRWFAERKFPDQNKEFQHKRGCSESREKFPTKKGLHCFAEVYNKLSSK